MLLSHLYVSKHKFIDVSALSLIAADCAMTIACIHNIAIIKNFTDSIMGRICQNVVSILFLDMINEAFQSILIIKRKQMLIILYETVLIMGNSVWWIKKHKITCLNPLFRNAKVTASKIYALKQLTSTS